MKKITNTYKINVDTGYIMAVFLEKESKNSFPIKKGKYKITMSVQDCWDGKSRSFDFLDVKKDSFLCVSDSFYKNDKEFYEVHELHKKGCAVRTGGDGSFEVKITISQINIIPYNPYEKATKDAKKFLKENKITASSVGIFSNRFLKGPYSYKLGKLLSEKERQVINKDLAKIKKILQKTSN